MEFTGLGLPGGRLRDLTGLGLWQGFLWKATDLRLRGLSGVHTELWLRGLLGKGTEVWL